MAPTIHMLRQHIGSIESWIDTVVKATPEYQELIRLECTIKDGVIVMDRECGATLYPDSFQCHFTEMASGYASRFFRVAEIYVTMLQSLDASKVQYAMELEARRADYKKAQIEDALDNKGILWLRRGTKVIKIKVIKLVKKMNFRSLEYKDLSSMSKEKQTASMRFIQLFLTQEEAFNPLEEGYHDR